jgi:uncharacterized protein YoxC
MRLRLLYLCLLLVARVEAQESPQVSATMEQILRRLDGLEKQNQQLMDEVRSLREQVAASRATAGDVVAEAAKEGQATQGQPTAQQPTLDERVTVEERRTAEQAQTKVEATSKFPIHLNGMLLFNAFSNSENYSTAVPGQYGLLSGPEESGATVRQTLLGLNFEGPRLPGNGRVNGTLMMDFWAGGPGPGSSWLRIRRADVSLDWANRSFTVGQDKPIIAPYQPDSLAEVGIPPLAGAGNLWLWLPQARYEERMHFGSNTGLTGQISILQTAENNAYTPMAITPTLELARPALEGRLAFWHSFDDTRRFEFGSGFHVGTSHVAGTSIPSHIASVDWMIVPSTHFRFSGTLFTGQNVAGLGASGNGFGFSPDGRAHPVQTRAGWLQLAFPLTSRLTFNLYSGLENDQSPYLYGGSIVRDWTYASNFMYHLGPNVVVSLEASQMRTRSFSDLGGVQNHYDLAIGYLF